MCSLALDSFGRPCISYYDSTNENLKYAAYDGSSWNLETVDATGKTGVYASLGIDSNDYPHIAYECVTTMDVKYAKFSDSGWTIETIDGAQDVVGAPSLALDSNDHPHVAYGEDASDTLRYATHNGVDWDIETVGTTSKGYWWRSLALDSQDRPGVSYFEYTWPHDIEYMHFEDTSWTSEIIGRADDRSHSSLAFDVNDNPHISYFGDLPRGLKYATFDGSSWSEEMVDVIGSDYSSLSLDSRGTAHIAYYRSGYLNYAVGSDTIGPNVPEPATGVLACLWLAALACCRRLRSISRIGPVGCGKPADGDFVHDEPRELVFVAEDAICAEADAFAHDPADQWYRQPPEDGPRELTFVDEDTFWNEF